LFLFNEKRFNDEASENRFAVDFECVADTFCLCLSVVLVLELLDGLRL
jgi:hypothetical protein